MGLKGWVRAQREKKSGQETKVGSLIVGIDTDKGVVACLVTRDQLSDITLGRVDAVLSQG